MELENAQLEAAAAWPIEPHPWRGFGLFDKLVAVLVPLLAAGIFILPFLDQSILRRLAQFPVVGGLVEWLATTGGSWMLGTALILFWVAYLLFRRWRIVSNEHQWVDAGCPQCLERDLVRVSRARNDRWYGLLNIPAYRYACRNCPWRGLRIARRHRDYVVAQEQLIVASSLTLEVAGSDANLQRQDTDFDELAPDRASELADVAELRDVVDAAYDAPAPESAVAEAEDVEATRPPAATEELDWLWRQLSDEEA